MSLLWSTLVTVFYFICFTGNQVLFLHGFHLVFLNGEGELLQINRSLAYLFRELFG